MEIIPSFLKWLESNGIGIDALVFDVDGVLAVGRQATPGSRELLAFLRHNGTPFVILTNDANHSTLQKAERLRSAEVKVSPDEIVSAGHGLIEITESNNLVGAKFFVMGSLGAPCYAVEAGMQVTRDMEEIDTCRGVIVGEENYDWESVINGVVNFFIRMPEALLIIPNPDEYFPRSMGRIHIGAGGVGRFIQKTLSTYGVEVDPVYLGKPYSPIFQFCLKQLEQKMGRLPDRRNVMMIGDFLDADIKGANDFGMRSALVLTGVTEEHMLENSPVKPELVFETL